MSKVSELYPEKTVKFAWERV